MVTFQELRDDLLPFGATKSNPSQKSDARFGVALLICGFRRVCIYTGLVPAGAVLTNGGEPGARLREPPKSADWA